jgi:hypothetical protein
MMAGNDKQYRPRGIEAVGDETQWLHAKARQLKERALSTADKTRRQQLLLIATEYQKLAQREEGGVELHFFGRAATTGSGRAAQLGIVTSLGVTPRQTPFGNSDVTAPTLERSFRPFRRIEVLSLAIWAVLALIAFALLLIPGDQTALGLREAFDLLID